MKFTASTVAAVAACLPNLAAAHYYFPHLIVDGVKSDEYVYVRRSTQGFQPHFGFDILSSDDLRCNTGAQENAASTEVASVKAGDEIAMSTNLDAKIEHPGPIQVYMSRATNDDVASYDGSGEWFKIFELGATFPMEASGDNWLVWGNSQINFTIPAEVPSGQYLVRIEHIALHRPSGTEFYFNCAQVEVTNDAAGLTAASADTILFPGSYNSSDPGFSPNFSIYSGATSYTFPGPEVFPTGNESEDSSSSSSGTEGQAAASSSAAPVASSSSAAPVIPSASSTAIPSPSVSTAPIAVPTSTSGSAPIPSGPAHDCPGRHGRPGKRSRIHGRRNAI
ncbi:glycosyl hydrolase family 61-domain-containing protein [Xylariaceae sp. FL0016]|nr:glycosyl hydrolase family 61-domain-containing protein [Xylariaceae sp. FL0016]